jgi:hypothetical protein
MKTNLIKLCAVILLTAQTIAFGQKTEVSVRKGKVIAKTGTTSVAVEAGRKAVLAPDKNPTVSVDNPMVDDALKLYKMIEAEKEQGDLKIDSAFIMVGKADKEEIVGAFFFEFPNHESEATNVFTLGPASIVEGLQVYDLNGNLCQLDVKLVSETAAIYSIHVSEQVQPGEHFKLIGVVDLENMPTFPGGAPAYGKEGPLRYFRTVNGVSNCLNYFRFILPESAILIDSNREIIATDTVDGRVAVTMRNYTGEYADGLCMISFLWPDQDGTTLADIPGKYRGLRSKQNERNIEKFRQEMDKIRAGIKFEDQSTPLGALLTCLSSIIHRDLDLYAAVKYTEQPPEKIQRYVEQAGYWANILDVLSTPEWPDNPGNGYVHPIYLCRKGTTICEFIQPIVYEDGKWYDHNTKSKQLAEIKNITPQNIAAARAEGYLCDWEVAGPYIQKGKKCSELFDIPFGPELVNADVPWQPISTEPHEQHPAYINLDKSLLHFDQAVAYLRTEIVSDAEKPARLEIYSDDGVKAWLNGKLVHANNINRGIPDKPDTVAIRLKKGSNNLMLKVTDDVWSWGAIVRLRPD